MIKCINVLILFISINILIFPSKVYVFDYDTKDTIYFAVFEYDGIVKQSLTPVEFEIGSRVKIGCIGYSYKDILIDKNIMSVYLVKSPIIYDPVIVDSKVYSPQLVFAKNSSGIADAVKEIGAFIDMREYNRNVVLSISGGPAEHISYSLDEIPIINQQSRAFDIEMIPPSIVQSLSLDRGASSNTNGENVFGGNIDMQTDSKKIMDFNFKADRGGSFSVGGMVSFNPFKCGYYKASHSNMILPGNIELKNSYKNVNGIFMKFDNRVLRATYIKSILKTGDAGIEGHRFYDAFTSQSFDMISFIFNAGKNFKFSNAITAFGYSYYNDEIAPFSFDSSSTLSYDNTFQYNTGNGSIGAFIQYNTITGTKVKSGEEFCNGVFLEREIFSTECEFSTGLSNLFYSEKRKDNLIYSLNLNRKIESEKMFIDYGIRASTRRPTFNELFWTGDIFASGNSSLENEKLYSLYINLNDSVNIFRWIIFGGYSYYRDLIRWDNAGGIYIPINVLSVSNPSVGINWSFTAKGFYSNIVIQADPYFIQDFKLLPYSSFISGNIKGGYNFSHFGFSFLSSFKSERFISNSNIKSMSGYYMVDKLELNFMHDSVLFSIFVSNPFDASVESVRGYLSEGRNVGFNINTGAL